MLYPQNWGCSMITSICDFCLREIAVFRVVHPYPFISDICTDCNAEKRYKKWATHARQAKKTTLITATKGEQHE